MKKGLTRQEIEKNIFFISLLSIAYIYVRKVSSIYTHIHLSNTSTNAVYSEVYMYIHIYIYIYISV